MWEVWASISGAGKSGGSGNTESVEGNHQDEGNGRETAGEGVVGRNTLTPTIATQNKENDGRAKTALVGRAAVLHSVG